MRPDVQAMVKDLQARRDRAEHRQARREAVLTALMIYGACLAVILGAYAATF